jgi:hypothetical protein
MKDNVIDHPTNAPVHATTEISGMLKKGTEASCQGLEKDKRGQNRGPLQVIENMHKAQILSDKRQPKRRRLD